MSKNQTEKKVINQNELDKDMKLGEKSDIKVKIGEHEFVAKYRKFRSGKSGYGVYNVCKLNDYPCRISLNIIEM